MPANSNFTLIRLMRGDTKSSEAWVPEVGEPLLDMESGTLLFGDGKTLGGIPINTVTSVNLETPRDLDTCKVWGRYFLNGDVSSLPDGVESPGRFLLTVESPDIGSSEIWQKLQVFEGVYAGKTFNRITLDKGLNWSSWRDIGGGSWDATGSGTYKGDTNINNYVLTSQAYVENISNGPVGSDGCGGFLFTYRQDAFSPYIFQKIILVGCPEFGGREFYRYSVNGNQDWEAPGFNWQEYTDFVHKDLLNATGVLPVQNGGTQRTDGTVWQADQSENIRYSNNENSWKENPYIQEEDN